MKSAFTNAITRALLAAAALLMTGLPAHASLVLRPPGLHAGDQFRVLFITSDTHDARSSDIASYDSFVNGLAVTAGIDSYFGSAVSWQVLGSTFGTSAIERVGLDAPALYGISGLRIADSGADLWDGSIDNAIYLDEQGRAQEGVVFTGTGADGRAAATPLGGTGGVLLSEAGLANLIVTNNGWVALGAVGGATPRHFYGVSSLLTVPEDGAEVPEPGTLALCALAAALRVKIEIRTGESASVRVGTCCL